MSPGMTRSGSMLADAPPLPPNHPSQRPGSVSQDAAAAGEDDDKKGKRRGSVAKFLKSIRKKKSGTSTGW